MSFNKRHLERMIAECVDTVVVDEPEKLKKMLLDTVPRDQYGEFRVEKTSRSILERKMRALLDIRDIRYWIKNAKPAESIHKEDHVITPDECAVEAERVRRLAGIKSPVGWYSDDDFHKIQRRLNESKWHS